ncbi:histidine phosphatase family protein [Tissierella sp. Yu-01]|uniref:histidine phosphatase family protein n=1 Tax=Tissierella sp. Yu-01 TaxID=3035694 RepID=UPI00240D509E|nr:histidine phosphatase family protein [Tissierella sp. Yu-01]WFA07699.1 histidine phosphatase family protein [Tissierella sp. Yu-01]
MKVYITRHGTTEWNLQRRLQGWQDSDLTKEGIDRAIKLGERLDSIDFDIIYTSPQNRALETAKLIRGNKKTPIVTHDGLKELGFGVWESMELSIIEKEYPKEYYTYRNNPIDYIPIGGESYEDLFKRVNDFFEEIKTIDAENILVVSHGVTIKALIKIIKNLTLDEFSKLPVYTGTSLNVVEINEDKMKFIMEDDTSHIEFEFYDEITI